MERPVFKAIAAMARNRVIGANGGIPWRIPDELRWFKQVTTGHTVLMGRKTWESLGRPLPNRRNIVVTRGPAPERVEAVHDLEHLDPALLAEPGTDVYIIGGGEIYARLLPKCEEVLLTTVFREAEGDVFFPPFEADFEDGGVVFGHPEFEVRRYVRRREAQGER